MLFLCTVFYVWYNYLLDTINTSKYSFQVFGFKFVLVENTKYSVRYSCLSR